MERITNCDGGKQEKLIRFKGEREKRGEKGMNEKAHL